MTTATNRSNSNIKVDVSSLQMVATLAGIDSKQSTWLANNGYTTHTDKHGNVSLTKPGKSVGDENAVWHISEDRQMWEVPAPAYFTSSFTGRFHVSLVSTIDGVERVYDAASKVTLRAALQMTR